MILLCSAIFVVGIWIGHWLGQYDADRRNMKIKEAEHDAEFILVAMEAHDLLENICQN